jgi:hypothetical protein
MNSDLRGGPRAPSVESGGTFQIKDGSVHQSPSLAAMKAADVVSCDGWHAWLVPRLAGTKLDELRMQYIASSQQSSQSGLPSD